MKKKGTTAEFSADRRREIVTAIRRQVAKQDTLDLLEACREVVKQSASRFWVSEEQAVRTLYAMHRGEAKFAMPAKRQMYEELDRRTRQLTARGIPLLDAVRQVVYLPAPEHYMSAVSAMNMYYKHLRQCRHGA